MKAMIFAAGLGTRLKPLTDTMPKALVPVGGQPLLWHVMRKLQASGFDEFVINVHHFAGQIASYLEENGNLGSDVRLSYETEQLLETGGGVRHAAALLEGGPFLVHNVDILSDIDLKWFVSQVRPESMSTLLVSSRETSRYLLFDNDMRLVGWTNVQTGEVRTPFEGLDVSACRRYAFSGIHFMSESILDVMQGWPERFSIIDFYLKEAAAHPVYGVVAEKIKLVDVGKLSTLDSLEHSYDQYK